jgi:hypothetical protein
MRSAQAHVRFTPESGHSAQDISKLNNRENALVTLIGFAMPFPQ